MPRRSVGESNSQPHKLQYFIFLYSFFLVQLPWCIKGQQILFGVRLSTMGSNLLCRHIWSVAGATTARSFQSMVSVCLAEAFALNLCTFFRISYLFAVARACHIMVLTCRRQDCPISHGLLFLFDGFESFAACC